MFDSTQYHYQKLVAYIYQHLLTVTSPTRCVPDPVLRDAAVRRDAAVLHGAGAGAVPPLRLPHALEEDLSSAQG